MTTKNDNYMLCGNCLWLTDHHDGARCAEVDGHGRLVRNPAGQPQRDTQCLMEDLRKLPKTRRARIRTAKKTGGK